MLFIPNIVYLYILFQQIVNFIGVLKEPSFKNFLLYLSVLSPPPPCFQTHIHMYTCLCTNVNINVWIAHVPLKIVFGRSNLIFPWETNWEIHKRKKNQLAVGNRVSSPFIFSSSFVIIIYLLCFLWVYSVWFFVLVSQVGLLSVFSNSI